MHKSSGELMPRKMYQFLFFGIDLNQVFSRAWINDIECIGKEKKKVDAFSKVTGCLKSRCLNPTQFFKDTPTFGFSGIGLGWFFQLDLVGFFQLDLVGFFQLDLVGFFSWIWSFFIGFG
jgi:hypothetical protein